MQQQQHSQNYPSQQIPQAGGGGGTAGYQSYPPTQAGYVAYGAPEPWNPSKRPHY
jgi:hypothetical protein